MPGQTHEGWRVNRREAAGGLSCSLVKLLCVTLHAHRSAVLERLDAELSCSNKLSAGAGPATCASVQSRLEFLKVKITWSKSADGVLLHPVWRQVQSKTGASTSLCISSSSCS